MSRIDNSLFQMQILLVDAKKRNAHDSIVQAFEDSVKALEQQPCEDCVSRKAMWKVVHECEKHNSPSWVWREMLSRLPSVTPTRLTGHWIDIGDEGIIFKCSLCGLRTTIESHYCPNCGARMAESEDKDADSN